MSQMNESCESLPPHVVDESCHTSELLSAFQVMSHVCHMRCQRLKKQRKRASRTQSLPPVTPIPFSPLSKRKSEGRHRAPCFLRLFFFFSTTPKTVEEGIESPVFAFSDVFSEPSVVTKNSGQTVHKNIYYNGMYVYVHIFKCMRMCVCVCVWLPVVMFFWSRLR